MIALNRNTASAMCCWWKCCLLPCLLFLRLSNSLVLNGNKKKAVIVGGGPAGLASALVISDLEEFDEVTILEADSKSSYDPSRAYFYNINKRGQRFTDKFNIDLSRKGVGITDFARQTIPADPDIVFDGVPFSRERTPEEREQMGTMYWIPRHELVELFMDRVKDNNKNDDQNETTIRICSGMICSRVEPTEDGRVCVIAACTANNNTETKFTTDLCVGADGLSSTVRQSLVDGSFDGWSNSRRSGRNFRLRQWTSPSTGLRIKGLRLQPNFTIPLGDRETEVSIENKYNYALKSMTTGPKESLELVLLPQKSSSDARPINICTMPNHNIWKMKDGDSMKAFFVKAFPRFDWDSVVAPNEWDTFAKTQGSRYPKCQYCPSLYVSSKSGGGVVLVGDALHAFPPDLGQGVNSALCDVMTLGDCFARASSSSNNKNTADDVSIQKSTTMIPKALEQYEQINIPESRALIELARCGAPFQYNQPSAFMKFRKSLWALNLALRILLNKVTMGISPKPAILLMMSSKMSFRQVMRRANTLTFLLWTLFGSAVWNIARLAR